MDIKLSRTVPAGIIGAIVFLIINFAALTQTQDLPDHALSPVISKQEAEKAASSFAQKQLHADVEAAFVMFQTEKHLGGYLQKEGLFEAYEQLYASKYPLDYYLVQANAADESIYLLRVHMRSGEIIGFEKTFPAPVQQDAENYEIAERYLTQIGYDLNDFTLLTENDASQYIYESKSQAIGEAQLQLRTVIENGRVVAFIPQFTVPDAFMQWLNDQNRSAERMSLASIAFSLFTGIAGIVAAAAYRKRISFSRGVWMTLIYLITASIHNFNLYPGLKTQFAGSPENNFAAMFTVAFSHLFTFFTAAAIYLALTSGDAMWNQMGRKLWPRMKDPKFGSRVMLAMGHGYMFCFMLLGLQSILFLIGEKYFNVWSVNDALFSNYNLLLPALFPLMAWAAAISEEALFRLFGIALFKKLFRSTGIAVLATSMIWAIGHTSYPIYPAYTRFVEVTILGLIFGWIMLRFGFLTAVYAHASFDAILMAFSLIALGGSLNVLSGIAYLFSPVMAAVILAQFHKRLVLRPRST